MITEKERVDLTRIEILETMVDRETEYIGVAIANGVKRWKVLCRAVLETGYTIAAVHMWNKRN